MKHALMISAGLLAAIAFAQPQEGQPPRFGEEARRGPGRGGFPGSLGFTTLDTNGDGTLQPEEIEAAPAVLLKKLDKNSDGRITADEVQTAFPDGRGRGRSEGGAAGNVVDDTVKTLMAFDANGDGKLSKSELPERMQGMFERADENKDGFLTADEIRKLATAQSAAAGSAGPGGPEGRRGDGFGPGPDREMNFIRMDPVLAVVDTNGDGILSVEEIRNASKSILKLDIDGDGNITREELMTALRRRRESEPRDH
jgi:Ca2+-binding EF-hand superfamily protein